MFLVLSGPGWSLGVAGKKPDRNLLRPHQFKMERKKNGFPQRPSIYNGT